MLRVFISKIQGRGLLVSNRVKISLGTVSISNYYQGIKSYENAFCLYKILLSWQGIVKYPCVSGHDLTVRDIMIWGLYIVKVTRDTFH